MLRRTLIIWKRFREGQLNWYMAAENLQERLRRLGLTTLQQRRPRGHLIETYKIVTGKERIETENFFTFHAGIYTHTHTYLFTNK